MSTYTETGKLILTKSILSAVDVVLIESQLSQGSIFTYGNYGTTLKLSSSPEIGYGFKYIQVDNKFVNTDPIILPFSGTHHIFARFSKSHVMHFGRVGRKFEYLLKKNGGLK
jgi:hypothetical protein